MVLWLKLNTEKLKIRNGKNFAATIWFLINLLQFFQKNYSNEITNWWNYFKVRQVCDFGKFCSFEKDYLQKRILEAKIERHWHKIQGNAIWIAKSRVPILIVLESIFGVGNVRKTRSQPDFHVEHSTRENLLSYRENQPRFSPSLIFSFFFSFFSSLLPLPLFFTSFLSSFFFFFTKKKRKAAGSSAWTYCCTAERGGPICLETKYPWKMKWTAM